MIHAENLIENFLLQELFDKSYPFKLVNSSLNRHLYRFSIKPDSVYSCWFELNKDGSYSVYFSSRSSRTTFELTGKREALSVIATVARIIKDFLDRFPDKVVVFSSYNPKLTNIYKKLVESRLSQLNLVHDSQALTGNTYIARKNEIITRYLDNYASL